MHRCYHEDRMSTPEEDGAKAGVSSLSDATPHESSKTDTASSPEREADGRQPVSTLHLGTDFEPA